MVKNKDIEIKYKQNNFWRKRKKKRKREKERETQTLMPVYDK